MKRTALPFVVWAVSLTILWQRESARERYLLVFFWLDIHTQYFMYLFFLVGKYNILICVLVLRSSSFVVICCLRFGCFPQQLNSSVSDFSLCFLHKLLSCQRQRNWQQQNKRKKKMQIIIMHAIPSVNELWVWL